MNCPHCGAHETQHTQKGGEEGVRGCATLPRQCRPATGSRPGTSTAYRHSQSPRTHPSTPALPSPYNPSTDYHLFIDANNAQDWTLDRRGNPTSQQDHPRGLAALRLILDVYSLADNFRYLHPVARKYTHIHHGPGGTKSAKRIDRIYSSRALHRQNAVPRVARVAHR